MLCRFYVHSAGCHPAFISFFFNRQPATSHCAYSGLPRPNQAYFCLFLPIPAIRMAYFVHYAG
ncbi:MAG: hypothetical protein IJ204_05625 [Paludibacteraceae bacterium]|nr:hypothetical protein [Paludibacteraceae bacterium]